MTIVARRKVIPLEIMVIVHGKSERLICQYIKSNIKIKLEIIAENKGKNSIQITGLKKTLGNTILKSADTFLKEHYDVQHERNKLKNFKLFIIMDTDDCTQKQLEDYKSKEMFKKHWLYDCIVPIYNITKLEDVLEKAQIPYNSKDKGKYVEIFPTNRGKLDVEQVEEFYEKIKTASNISNLHVFIAECLEIQKKYNDFA